MKTIANTIVNNKQFVALVVIVSGFVGLVVYNFIKYGANF
jgi:hypothetical protein